MYDEADYFAFSPSGTQGVYYKTNSYIASVIRVDFASDALTTLGEGVLPVYSKDGSHIAFTRFVLGPAPDYTLSEQLFVMRADGSDQVQLTDEEVDGVKYYADDWSQDGTRILINRGGAMRIINVATHVMTHLPNGYPGVGSWFQH
jgi:Tol biopolymer transport system component